MWNDFDGKPYSREEFLALLEAIPAERLHWCKYLTVHNTASPSIKQWMGPAATAAQRIVNLQEFYEKKRGWSAGPHAFIPPDPHVVAYGFTKLTRPGVHASCFNKNSIGLEMVGDFDSEDFNSGPGAVVRDNAIFVMAALHNKMGIRPDGYELGKSGLHFHIDCKRDAHDCPGKKVNRTALVAAILAEMNHQAGGPVTAGAHDPSLGALAGSAGAAAIMASPTADEPMSVAATVPEDKPGFWERFNFSLVNDFAEQGSRLAGSLRTVKNVLHGLIWGPPAASGAAVKVANTGTAQVAVAHPNLMLMILGVGIGISVAAGIVYLIIKFAVEPHFVSAAKDKRYAPRGAQPAGATA